uniref:type II secretion system protein GspD n=1 Tax=Pelomonas sp. KK5 TaxID=1855730 RepID=UPI00097C6D21
ATVGGGGQGGGFSSIQASALSTVSKSDVWAEVEDSLRTLLGCQIPRALPTRQSGGGGGGGGGNAGGSASGSQGNGSRADVNFSGDSQLSERARGVDGCTDGRALTVNQMSGTVLVRAMPRELRQVEGMLRAMQLNIERQVIIEAKIIDVVLNSGAQQGIDWAGLHYNLHRISVGANTDTMLAPGSIIRGQPITGTVNGKDANGNSTSATYTAATVANPAGGILDGTTLSRLLGAGTGMGLAIQGAQFAALINFLQTQGEVHVLSSPRIATLNNQKAVLKVGAEESFVTSITGGTSTLTSGTSTSTAPTLNYQPFFSGIALDVTPQIDELDRITLHVHALVNSISEKSKIALLTTNAPSVPFAVNSISETDSVVKTQDGLMVVIGGLMMETSSDNRAKVPLAGDVPVAGTLFRKGDQATSKRELVILLKPTVVKDERDWTRDISDAERRITEMNLRKDRKAQQD